MREDLVYFRIQTFCNGYPNRIHSRSSAVKPRRWEPERECEELVIGCVPWTHGAPFSISCNNCAPGDSKSNETITVAVRYL